MQECALRARGDPPRGGYSNQSRSLCLRMNADTMSFGGGLALLREALVVLHVRACWPRAAAAEPLRTAAAVGQAAAHRTASHRTASHRTAPHRIAPHRTAPQR